MKSGSLALVLCFVVVLVLTPVFARLARKIGMVAQPRADRWHTQPTALLGGIPIVLGFSLLVAVFGAGLQQAWGIFLGSGLVFTLGLIDDIYHLKPFPKLIGNILAAGVVLSSGLALPWFGHDFLNVLVTVFWLVGITNAMNLLDNMDGLAGGIALIAGVFLALSFLIEGKTSEATVALLFAGAVAGFLVYNFPPASVFMGDCGSMFLGFFLGSLTLLSGFGRSRNLLYVMAGPVLPFLIPIFDTTFVTTSRIFSGRRVSQGGHDHTSHRLARIAGSERTAVLILYLFAGVSGLLSVLVRLGYFSVSFALIPTVCLFLTFFGVYLGQVEVSTSQAARNSPKLTRLVDILLRNGVFQIALDALLIILAYYSALLLRYEGSIPPGAMRMFFRVVPGFIAIKLAVFVAMGLYRDIWRYAGLSSMLLYARAIAVSSVICVLGVLFVQRFIGFSRAAIVMDALILMFLISGTRVSFRIFHTALPRKREIASGNQKALIYDAGEMGSLLVRQLENDPSFGYTPLGFIDDNPDKLLKTVNGYKILSGSTGLAAVLRSQPVGALLVACKQLPEEKLEELRRVCASMQVPVKRVVIRIE